MAHDVAQHGLVVFYEPVYHRLAANVYRTCDVAEVTAWAYAPRQ